MICERCKEEKHFDGWNAERKFVCKDCRDEIKEQQLKEERMQKEAINRI